LSAPTSGGLVQAGSDADWRDFEAALRQRRDLIYDYLDNWPGAEEFRPRDIHDGLFSYVKRRGKALRPLVLLLSCGAVGGDESQALPAAAAVEIYHTWTLVHDDIIDRDETRRGNPTVHARYTSQARMAHGLGQSEAAHYGTAVAILSGDLQHSWCYALLCDLVGRGVQPGRVLELVRRMSSWLTPQLMEGEMLDVQMSLLPRDDLAEAHILDMSSKKTSSLLDYAAWCGAMIGLGDKPHAAEQAAHLGRFANLCGTAFQMHDDVLGLTADESLLGKSVGADIREGKRTLVVYRALSRASESQRATLLDALGNGEATASEVQRAIEIIHDTNAIAEVSELANSYISQALAELDSLADTKYKQLLRLWATFLLARRY
jgi:geranylgeranyl diphosphate synthase type I